MREIKVLFVCLGNICRSPLAEGIFKKLIEERGLLKHFHFDSAGTAAYHTGSPPDPRSFEIAGQHNILLEHTARKINDHDFQTFDYILAMDTSNYQHIKAQMERHPKIKSQLFKMRDFDAQKSGRDVPDPYYGGLKGFEKVYEMLEEACNIFIDYLEENHPFLQSNS
ncbi:MAG: low molecular weight phosphotyrosine protein phosphatase [Cyclobacteriaceae bacterium]|nr:low molecular weight phosphotyrosine protein phosphatase [Cyclobacteriaceae bacterium]